MKKNYLGEFSSLSVRSPCSCDKMQSGTKFAPPLLSPGFPENKFCLLTSALPPSPSPSPFPSCQNFHRLLVDSQHWRKKKIGTENFNSFFSLLNFRVWQQTTTDPSPSFPAFDFDEHMDMFHVSVKTSVLLPGWIRLFVSLFPYIRFFPPLSRHLGSGVT